MKHFSTLAAAALVIAGCSSNGWTSAEKAVVGDGGLMRVLTIDDKADSLVLRTPCSEITDAMLLDGTFRTLADAMVTTVTDPSQDGVGIAAPQVGISRRVVAVMRFDKPGEPFEVYPNVRIMETRGEMLPGPEGCLSIPGRRGMVNRYRDITVRYSVVRDGEVRDTLENVSGYTAIIFQHECDHLDGVLYIDKLVEDETAD